MTREKDAAARAELADPRAPTQTDERPHAPQPALAGERPRDGRLAAGDVVDRYVVEGELGTGGMGAVVVARDPELDRKLALKVLLPNAGTQLRLAREGQAIAKLRHPNVVTVYDVGTHGAALFIAMELVEGGTLRSWLGTARPWPEIAAVFAQVGRGLAAAHDAGLVHRDVKPENVLMGDDGRVVVSDFGLARTSDEAPAPRDSKSALDLELTHTGATLGTPAYMSPEQHVGGAIDARSDQFSFCVALFEALHGVRPFSGATYEELRAAVLAGRVTARRRRGVPARVQRLVMRGLSHDPAARWPSMAALVAALEAAARPRGPRRAGTGLAAVALVAAALALGRWAHAPPRTGRPAREHAAPPAPPAASGYTLPGVSAADRATLAGTITDGAHHPIPHARVCADAHDDLLPHELVRDPRCTNTDVHGHYTLDGLYPARYVVRAMAKGLRPATHDPAGPPLAAGEHRDGIDVQLAPGGAEITGIVVDATGGPIAHAQVRVEVRRWSGTYDPAIESDDDGRFALPAALGDARVVAHADGYAEGADLVRAPGAARIVLAPGASFEGTVVDARTGAPVPGVRVAIRAASELEGRAGDDDLSDDRGRFRATRLAAGRYLLTARAPHGYGQSEGSIVVAAGERARGVVLKLYPALQVVGRIDGPPGASAACKVTLHGADPGRDANAIHAAGALHVDGVVPGRYEVKLACDGYRPVAPPAPLAITDRDLTGLVWRVAPVAHTGEASRGRAAHEPKATIRGVVVDTHGRPVADVPVYARTWGVRGMSPDDLVRTDPRGAFAIDDLAPGDYQVFAMRDAGVDVLRRPGAPRDLAAGAHVVVGADRTATARIVVEARDGELHGTCLDGGGAPVPYASIQLAREADDDVARATRETRWTRDERPIYAGPDGTFAIANLPRGRYTVRAAWRGNEVVAHHVATGAPLTLRFPTTGTIAGTARLGGAAPQELAITVDALGSALARTETFFHTSGAFAVRDLPPGRYRVTVASRDGDAVATVELAPGASAGVDVTLSRYLAVRGRVVDFATHQPIAGVHVVTARPGQATRKAEDTSDAAGRFTIPHAPGGAVVFEAFTVDLGVELGFQRVLPRTGPVDLGDLIVVRRAAPEPDLGLRFVQPLEHHAGPRLRIAWVAPHGPAAKAGIVVGDTIVTIDGVDASGTAPLNPEALLDTAPGTHHALGLARGLTVTIVVPSSR